jgi:superfamily II DNA or RNA helicase/very-short-patch-repair endonuclease
MGVVGNRAGNGLTTLDLRHAHESWFCMGDVNNLSLPDAKVELFMRLFWGRHDLYARRFESVKTGKSGYQPACANEWARGLCEKPRVSCGTCRYRRFLPITREAVGQHLMGQDAAGRLFVMGIYPLMLDERCAFVAADFDREQWRDDAAAVRQCGRELGFPPAVERSRSGQGAHLWWFFEHPIPARLAREFASSILTATLDRRPEIGLDSFDRLFPNQDTLPKGGFGNLIALPLQKRARQSDNSVFVDEAFQPYEDQWAFLAAVPRLRQNDLENHVASACRAQRILPADSVDGDETVGEPWRVLPSQRQGLPPLTGPLPRELEAVFAERLYLPLRELTPALRTRIIRLATFQNPEFYRAQAMRINTYGKPRLITCAETEGEYLLLPRGCLGDLAELLQGHDITLIIRDERIAGARLSVEFHGELRPEQKHAAQALMNHDTGVLAAGTAFGKTVVAAWMIARRGVNTLVLVNRQQLQAQWVARLAAFLDLPEKNIGRLGAGHRKLTHGVDVALIQSLCRKGVVDDSVAEYGHVIADECHALAAPSFEHVMRHVKAKYVLGLSATPTRKDGRHPIIFMQCGAVRHRVDARQQARTEAFAHVVLVRPTRFEAPVATPEEESNLTFLSLCDALAGDSGRNALIVRDVLAALGAGRSPVVLTERRAHLDTLERAFDAKVKHLIVLRGGLGKRQVTAIREHLLAIPDHEERLLLATGSYLGEGFDDARLDTLFLVMPISWRGRVAQYAGRLHRQHAGKHEVRIHDYADLKVPMLARMFDRRCRGYRAIGYGIVLPLDAIAGWPAEVDLPVEPGWQETYAASVRRLCRDGVDEPLANLFVHAVARLIEDSDKRQVLARSAAEAFLFRRLETLAETQGLFALNQRLAIPSAGSGSLEVDLASSSLHLAIEIDGPQHLADADAYRRDRGKDRLLQEHGYRVLRFLAEDVCQRLDDVLDIILRTEVQLRERRRTFGSSRESMESIAVDRNR